MTNSIYLDPKELALVLSFMGVDDVLGWNGSLFRPAPGDETFHEEGLALLEAAGRVTRNAEGAASFDAGVREIAEVLADPMIVIQTLRKAGDGARTMTHHIKGTDVIEMTRGLDGRFEVQREPSLAAAAGAAAAYVGASNEPADGARFEATAEKFALVRKLAREGNPKAIAALQSVGASEAQARSAASALASPTTAGVINLMYCAAGRVQAAESYAVTTNAENETWVQFAPGSAGGVAILERTSLAGMASRIMVAVTSRVLVPI